MSTGTWTPESEKNTINANDVDRDRYIELGRQDALTSLVDELPAEDIQKLMPLMKQERDFWFDVAEKLEREEIISLIRFFTIAEEQHSELFAGNHSPVIAFNKLLKQRKEPLDKEMLLWIRANSSNRFLPNGSVL